MSEEEITDLNLILPEREYIRASTGKRFANYVIDLLLFYFLAFIGGLVLALLYPATMDLLFSDRPGFDLVGRLFSLLCYAIYMGTVEAVFKGKSLGKLITNTRAVDLEGYQISSSKAFERGFSRAVPFCVLSAFGTPCNPWQDRWTGTMVIDEALSYQHNVPEMSHVG